MKFRTTLTPVTTPHAFTHQHPILAVGSCFASHIAAKLKDRKFQVFENPFGIIYNPLSLATCLDRLVSEDPFSAHELIEYNGKWLSLAHHGQFSGSSPTEALEKINDGLRMGSTFLQKTDILILTPGTAFVYEYQPTRTVVANCHKLPANQFIKRLLTTDEIVHAWQRTIEKLLSRRPKLQIILSVSPVRHLRDGMIENQRSKATLLLAAAEIQKRINQVHYFPAYELLMDDLRDYRFYDTDLVHPSTMAIDYIWEFFSQTWITETGRQLANQVEKIRRAVDHRPISPSSPAHQAFIQKQLETIQQLQNNHKYLDFKEETRKLLTNR